MNRGSCKRKLVIIISPIQKLHGGVTHAPPKLYEHLFAFSERTGTLKGVSEEAKLGGVGLGFLRKPVPPTGYLLFR